MSPTTAPQSVFPFVVGSGRSGTTLVRAMLDSHPDLAVPDEVSFVVRLARPNYAVRYGWPWRFDAARCTELLLAAPSLRRWGLPEDELRRSLADPPPVDLPDAIRRVYACYAAHAGKRRYADKTPAHVEHLRRLARSFPEARFVHVVRDGRDVALSYLDVPWGPSTVTAAAVEWRRRVASGRRAGRRLGPARYHEVRYEELVRDPEPVLRDVCAFLDLQYDELMLRYAERADEVIAATRFPAAHSGLRRPPTPRLRDWRTAMAPADVEAFEAVAGPLLTELGYERSTEPVPLARRLRGAAHVVGARLDRSRREALAGSRGLLRALRGSA